MPRMFVKMIALLGLGTASLHFSKKVQRVGEDIANYVNSQLIRKELNSQSGSVTEWVQGFARRDMIT
jgi:hypothetical protein